MIWSALQGIMGKVFGTQKKNPLSAMVVLGDFCFFGGLPDKELVSYRQAWLSKGFLIMVPQNEEWGSLIEDAYKESAKRVVRYALKKEGDIFDRKYLRDLAAGLPEEYELKLIDEKIFRQCQSNEWSRDLVSQFETYEKYQQLGLGVAVLKDDIIVAGASSYTRYREGIEIEIDTRKDHRRKGLASACGARLILECLERSLYPSWDAQNRWSVALAEKLGYHFSHEYKAYEINMT